MIQNRVDPRKFLLIPCVVVACGGGGADIPAPDAGPPDAAAPNAICGELGLPELAFADGPFGVHRGELADDFTMELRDGALWSLREHWAGCESYVFLTDRIATSTADATPVWEHDVDALIATSPRNAHYFFVSMQGSGRDAITAAMVDRIDTALAALSPEDAAHWREHLHVAREAGYSQDGWLGDVFTGLGRDGFAIDRGQRIRGLGMLADVTRYDPNLSGWPWESNLAYAAHEVRYFDGEAARAAELAAEDATVVTFWTGDVLAEFAELDVALPDAATMAGFDTLIVDVTSQCPDADQVEFNNCGAWDYLAHLWVQDQATSSWIELARFITPYHRESHWVVDVSPMLAFLKDGGTRHFKWEFAPSWNTQPTATTLSLRLSNRGKGYHPVEVVPLWTGGPFGSTYNTSRPPIDVAIPADATRVEMFALVTGHGADDVRSCAEFCNHQHELAVGTSTYRKEFPMAATEAGCVAEAASGMTPNQGGTWWYGRGGWCPGQQVTPWLVDITGDVAAGATATLTYRGLYADATPPDGSGDIALSSYLVISK